jgi:4-hydroxy-tetrahydrodipicolinate synthase
VFAGSERYLLDTLRWGGAGCISATVNVFAPQAREVYDRWEAGEDAEPAQATLTEARAFMDGRPLIPALKALMRELTGDERWLNLRPPLDPLDDGEARDLRAHLPAIARV